MAKVTYTLSGVYAEPVDNKEQFPSVLTVAGEKEKNITENISKELPDAKITCRQEFASGQFTLHFSVKIVEEIPDVEKAQSFQDILTGVEETLAEHHGKLPEFFLKMSWKITE